MTRKSGLGLLAAALIAMGGLWMTAERGALSPFGAAEAQTAEALPEVPDLVLGAEDASVTVIEYASYTCPHCATFHQNVFKPLKADYIDTGKIQFIYREVYFDRFALWAAMVARCGGTERYFGISELLYDQQRDWAGSNDPQAVISSLRRIGRTAGLGEDQLNACLEDADMAQAMVAKFQAETEADDINATPSLVINGQKHSNMSYAQLSGIIDGLLAD